MKGSVAFQHVQGPIGDTLAWLVAHEKRAAAREMAHAIARQMPDETIRNDFLASLLFKAKYPAEALGYALRTVELLPESEGARFNLAKIFHAVGRSTEAVATIRNALATRPDWVDAKIDLSLYLCASGHTNEAFQILSELRGVLALGTVNRTIIEFNLGWHFIRLGRFADGMAQLRQGRQIAVWGSEAGLNFPILTARADLQGKVVLVLGEGGIGDEMITVRFTRLLKDRGAKVIWASRHNLGSLFERCDGIAQCVPLSGASAVNADYWIPAMDLCASLELPIEAVSGKPYLSADPEKTKEWGRRFPGTGRLRVGLRWQGNPLYEQDLLRSVPFALLESLTAYEGAEFYSLQRDEGAEELPSGSPVIDLGPRLVNWEETAAAIAHLDLVISSCTSVVHLAAAMGKPTWLLCPMNCYYLWAIPGDRSPWYESIRLFRQARPQRWEEPVAEIRRALARRTSQP